MHEGVYADGVDGAHEDHGYEEHDRNGDRSGCGRDAKAVPPGSWQQCNVGFQRRRTAGAEKRDRAGVAGRLVGASEGGANSSARRRKQRGRGGGRRAA